MSQPDDIEDLLGRVWCDRYQLLEYVGRGGMGAVFKARQVHMGREVALKVIHRRLCQDEKQIQRFEQEARSSSKLNHPNNIRVFDYGTSDDGRLFMAMEFLKGKTLGQLILDEGTIHPDRVAHIARQMFKSLAEAHELDLVHRDLKPENIFICEIFGETDFVKVLDFGIAKAIGPTEEDAKLTQTGFICGTPRYLSPEQALGQAVDGRADLYSVGVLMYEMLTGRPPFIGENPISIVMKHVHDDPPPIVGVERHGERARKLIWLVERLLEKNPARRPSPAEQIVQFLDGNLDETQLAGHLGRPLSRHKGPRSLRRLTPLPQMLGGEDVDGAVPRSAFRTTGSETTTSRRTAIGGDAVYDNRTPKPPPLPHDAIAGHSSVMRDRRSTPSLYDTTVVPQPDRETTPDSSVPASDETALIARPAALQNGIGDTRPGETQQLQSNKDTRLIPQSALVEGLPPSEGHADVGRAPVQPVMLPPPSAAVNPGEPSPPAPAAAVREEGPLWAWALAGVAIAVMVLSVFTYTWSQSKRRSADNRSAASRQALAEQSAVKGEVTGRAIATVEIEASPAPREERAANAAAPVQEVSQEATEPPSVGVAGSQIGAILAVMAPPDPPAPVEAKDEAPAAEPEGDRTGASTTAGSSQNDGSASAEVSARQQRREKAKAAAEERALRAQERAAQRAAERERRAAERKQGEIDRAAKRAEARAKYEEKRAAAKAEREARAAAKKAEREAQAAARKAAWEKRKRERAEAAKRAPKPAPKRAAKRTSSKKKPKTEKKPPAKAKPKRPASDPFEPF